MSKIKKYIKSKLSDIIGNNIDKLEIITEWVSFDIFDTLILRKCGEPSSVFHIISEIEPGFAKQRILAEQKARQMTEQNEITIDDIYARLEKVYGKDKSDRLKEFEIETELNMCIPNMEMVIFYEKQLAEGKHVLLTSDMYLSEEVIQKMLSKCGIYGYQKLYVSSEFRETKKDGSIFDIILNQNGILNYQLTHIGDNLRSDYWMPKKKGIHVFLYKRRLHHNLYMKDIKSKLGYEVTAKMRDDYSVMRSISLNCCHGDNDAYYVGSQVLGPIIYGFSHWLHDWAIANKIPKLFFLAREGYVLREGYIQLFGEDEIPTEYINVSRFSICMGKVIYTHSFEDLKKLFNTHLYKISTVEEIIGFLGISDRLDKVCENLNCEKSDKLDHIDKDKLYAEIMTLGSDYFKNQNENLLAYLELKGIKNKSIIALVDVGWVGTMQILLSDLIPESQIIGNYIAVNNDIPYESLIRRGYWIDKNEWDKNGNIIRFSMNAIEEIFMTEEGTTIGYKKKNDVIIPIKDSSFISEEKIEKLKAVHIGMNDFLKSFNGIEILNEPYIFFWPYLNLAIFPTSESVSFFSDFSFKNGFVKRTLLPQHNLIYYIIHPSKAKKELEGHGCKVVWVKSLFKIPFPYYSTLCFLKEKIKITSEFAKVYSKKPFVGNK